MNEILEEFVKKSNYLKALYSAGPGSLLVENINYMQPCFGRNDKIYEEAEMFVMNYLSNLTSHENVVRLQGSATLAIEIAILNFCRGKILIVETGYYSNRLKQICEKHSPLTKTKVSSVLYENLDEVSNQKFDWILACHTETSIGLKIDERAISRLAKKVNAQILFDSTASIGIEKGSELADIICYSSCKGLFGLTGASFIAFRDQIIYEAEYSYYLSIKTHIQKGITGPYHTILSLFGVFQNYDKYLKRLEKWHKCFLKVFEKNLVHKVNQQPKLCTLLDQEIIYKKDNPVPYKPRINITGSVVCHIGQIHNDLNEINPNLINEHFSINQ